MLNAKHLPCAIMLLPLAIADVNAETAQQDQMIITAKAPVTEADFAGSVTTVTAEEIQLSGATNILEAIQMVPGISVNSVSSQASGRNGISIRGMENNHTLILIDGRRISDTDTNVPFSDFQYNWVPLVAVERIEVVRGPMSNLYGSSALGGVINIITTNADKEWSTTVEAQLSKVDSGNGGDAKDFSLATSGTLGDSVDLSFAIEQQDSDAFQNSFPSGSSANKEGKDSRNLILKAGFNISENTRLGFNVVDSDDDRTQYPDTLSYTIKRNQTGLELSNSINGFDINTNIYRSTSDNDIESQAYVHKLEENVATVDLGGQLNEQHFLTAGIEYSNEEYHKDYDSTSSFEFKDKFKSWSAFAQDRFDLSDELTLTWGARYDDHQRFGNALSPKAYLNWDISDAWQIKTGYGEGFKAPAVKDASDAYNFEYTYPTAFGGPGGSPSAFQRNVFLGNSDLKEETSRTIEFGANYSQGKLNGGFTLFHSKVKDLISTNEISRVTVGPTTTVTSQYENVANAKITGLETEMGYSFTDNLEASFNFSLIDHEDSDTGKWLTQRSQREANLALTHRAPSWNLTSRLQIQYNGKQYTDSANTNVTPANTVVDLNLRKALGQHAYATFGIKNLLDDYAAEDDTNDSTSETGRQFMLTIGASF